MTVFRVFLAILVFGILSVSGSALAACVMPKPTEIIVIPSTEDIKYDFSQKLSEIQDVDMDTQNPYGLHAKTMTQGFMKGGIQIKPEVKLNFKTLRRSQGVCMWYETIKISVDIDPTIVIGKEVAKDRCMKAAVIEHEHKHIRADREIVNEYAQETAQKVYQKLKSSGFIYGPASFEQAEDVASAMYDQVFSVIKAENKIMQVERSRVQQAIDSKEEYDRVAALCPDFNGHRYIKKDEKNRRRR